MRIALRKRAGFVVVTLLICSITVYLALRTNDATTPTSTTPSDSNEKQSEDVVSKRFNDGTQDDAQQEGDLFQLGTDSTTFVSPFSTQPYLENFDDLNHENGKQSPALGPSTSPAPERNITMNDVTSFMQGLDGGGGGNTSILTGPLTAACFPRDGAELADAVMRQTCPLVILTNYTDNYMVPETVSACGGCSVMRSAGIPMVVVVVAFAFLVTLTTTCTLNFSFFSPCVYDQ